MATDNTKTHTDIKSDRFLIRILPEQVKPYGLLMRLDRPIGSWLLLLPALWAIALATAMTGSFNADIVRLMALFAVGAIIMRGAGCVINDLWDRDLDRAVARTRSRPLASGQITLWHGIAFLGGLLFCGLVILLQMSLVTVLLGIMALPFIALYPLMKRITFWPQAFLGLTFNFGALMGWAAVTDIVALPALLLYGAGFFWTMGYDTIYAHQDKEDDLLAGIKSTALKFGDHSKKWVGGLYALCFLLLNAAFITAEAGLLSFLVLIIAGLHLTAQIIYWDSDSQDSSLRTFRANRNFGLLVLLAALL